ncbi:MmgE/PrpD family protein, partial [Angustibacter speluncae]
AGAAAGCARLRGLTPEQVAAAVDAGAGLPVAGHFSSALDGNPVRDAWMGASNTSGLAAARMASAGQARSTGTAAGSLGALLGELEPDALTDGLGERWDLGLGYFKRHASCSFTHPVADAVLDLRGPAADAAEVEQLVVETHRLATGLDRTTWDSRLGAMFSIPFVAAAAWVHGEVGPRVSGDDLRDDPRVAALAARVEVRPAPDLDARLPAERAARVFVRTAAGTLVREVPNPVGDADHHPLDEDDVIALLRGWLDDDGRGDQVVDLLRATVAELPGSDDVGPLLQGLR